MNAFTFSGGSLGAGISLKQDPKFGLVVFLGEEGRGRRYEKVSLSRKNPPEVRENRVFDLELVKIPVPANGNKPATEFWVLAKPSKPNDGSVVVRIDTEGTYTRDSVGSWKAVKGNPETVIKGYGAYGDAGRIGNWDDGLVIMRPGDVLRVKRSGGYKNRPDALFFDQQGNLTSMDFEEWEAMNAIESFEEGVKPESSNQLAADLLFATMPAFSFSSDTRWTLQRGIGTMVIGTGRGFQLGPKGDGWRSFERVTVMTAEGLPEIVERAAVTKSGKNLILVKSDRVEAGKFLVRLNTESFRKRGYTTATIIRGQPTKLAEGSMHHGSANPISHYDMLWVIGEGDVLRIGQQSEEYSSDHALFVEGGELKLEQYYAWELRDARRDPTPYIIKGWCPIELLPEAWIGKVVALGDADKASVTGGTYGVTAVKPEILLNMRWDELTQREGNPNVHPWPGTVWAQLTGQEMSAKPSVSSVEEKFEFSNPPMSDGTRVVATIKTVHEHHEASWGHQAYDSTEYELEIQDVPARKVKVTHYEISGSSREEREDLGEVKTVYRVKDSGQYKIHLPEGVTELDGEVAVQFVEPKRSGWFINVLTQEFLDREKEEILAEIRENLPLRKLARQIPGEENIFGMPVGEDGYTPCAAEEAKSWVLFERWFKWPNAFTEAFVMVHYKGYRSKSTGATFEALVREFKR